MRTNSRSILTLALAAPAALTTACLQNDPFPTGGTQHCAAGTAVFTTLPIANSAIKGWVPLGNLNPPAHTFPTDHQYIYLANPAASTEIDAPATIWITLVKKSSYSTGAVDYSVDFLPCAEVEGEFGHVASLVTEITDLLGPIDQSCTTYSPNPGLSVTQCYSRRTAIRVQEAAPIGTAGGPSGVCCALDFSLWDNRINPHLFASPSRWTASIDGFDRFHVVAASDYFAEPAKSTIAAKLGSFDGGTLRTVPPVGGTVAEDVAGTLQSSWFIAGQPTFPESPHLAIVPDNVDPTIMVFSVGTSHTGYGGGTSNFVPANSGSVNLAPVSVTPGPTIYCYETQNNGPVFIAQLETATKLNLELRQAAGSCAAQQPYAFNAAQTVAYSR